ncbi:MAG: S1 family peptidase [candidate division KSB1 bacterium]|nr:S1 family peptidase [candidate division KSB1 bacterium]
MATEEQVRAVRARVQTELLRKANVVGVGIGYKEKGGQKTEEICLVVLVEKKLPREELAPEDLVPSVIEGVVTDVKEVGKIVAQQARTDRWRPAPPGVSIGHWAITAGTFGAVVRDRGTGQRLILSNNHVLANSNDAAVGDPILQPGPADGGHHPQDRIADLLRFVRIVFEGGGGDGEGGICRIAAFASQVANLAARLLGSEWRLHPVRAVQQANRVDAAVARPISGDVITDAVLEVGEIHGTTAPHLGMAVLKSGRTTAVTTGTIELLDATVRVSYGAAGTALFEGQIVTGNMSAPGDSGSLLVEASSRRAVGLLFAGSDQSTVYNPIPDVLSALDLEIP